MKYNEDTLNMVYDKTGGYCRYCEKRIYWKNYGAPGERGAWEVDHSVPIALGGTDSLRNLWPACVGCNRDKGTMTGPQYMHLFEDPQAQRTSPWEDIAKVILGAVAIGMFLNWLSNTSQSLPRRF